MHLPVFTGINAINTTESKLFIYFHIVLNA